MRSPASSGIVINGSFLCRNLTGIERFAREVCVRMDRITLPGQLAIYIPANARDVPRLSNIVPVVSKRACHSFPVWDHIVFTWYLARTRSRALDFSNTTPWLRPGYAFLHDIYFKLFPHDFTSLKDRMIQLYSLIMYRRICRKCALILTVSEYSRGLICREYSVPEERVAVINNGWEHFRDVQADGSVFARFPHLREKSYFLTLGSLSKRKNLRWIAEYARLHPEQHFAISGAAISGLVPPELEGLKTMQNVSLLGYVSDGQIKALMQGARAFVFPSYYEGFGIPPLEALSCGCPIVVARAASLPELFGTAARYIQPDDWNVNLEELLRHPVSGAEPVLRRYTYDRAAETLKKALRL